MIEIPDSTIRSIEGQSDILAQISTDRLNAWVQYGESKSADEFADYVKSAKLSGNPMHIRTRELHDSVGSARLKRGKYRGKLVIRPGVGINGCLNYLNKWVGTNLEFMAPAAREFSQSGRIKRNVNDNISRMLDKVAKEMRNA